MTEDGSKNIKLQNLRRLECQDCYDADFIYFFFVQYTYCWTTQQHEETYGKVGISKAESAKLVLQRLCFLSNC